MNEPAALGNTLSMPLKVAYAEHVDEANGPEELAAIAGVEVSQVVAAFADPAKFAELEAYRSAYQKQGKHQPGRVRKLLWQTLDVIQKHLDDGCDIDAALEIIKPLIRLTEIAEKSRIAESASVAISEGPVFYITIGGVLAGGTANASPLQNLAGVVDVQARQVADSAGEVL